MGLIVRRRVTLDLSRRGHRVTVPFSLGDVGAHEVIFTLRDGSEQILLPVGTHAEIAVKNGYDGKGCLDSCVIDNVNNTVTYTPTPEALSVEGNIECTLHVVGEYGEELGSPTFIFAVSEGDNANTETELGKALKANSSWGVIADTANNALDAAQAKEDAEAARDAAVTAQGFAEGARDAAATSAGAAATSAGNAATSEGNAATSAGNAATSAGNAATSAGNAATSEGNAAKSAEAAETSATRAEENADLAEGYVKNVQATGKAVEVVNETGNSRTAAMSQDGVSKLVYPFGAIVEDFSETGTFLKIDRAIKGEIIKINSSIGDAIVTNSNMFSPANSFGNGATQSRGGITLKYNGDGTYICTGKAEKEVILYLSIYNDDYICKAGTYTISLNCALPYRVKVQFAVYRAFENTYSETFSWTYNGGTVQTGVKKFDEDFRFQARIIIDSGVTLNNLVLKPQLSPGKEKSEWTTPIRKTLNTIGKPAEVKYGGEPLYFFPGPRNASTVFTVTASYRFRMYSMKETLEILRETLTDLYNRRCDADEVDIDLDLSGIGMGKVATDVQAAIQTMADMIPQFATNASVKNTITTEISKIVANAPADLNTLKEIADYIASDKTNAANINNTLSEHTKKLSEIEEGYVKKIKGSGLNQLYGISPGGEQTSFKAQANSPEMYSVPLRDENLQFMVGPPINPEHVATKQYVDDGFVPKVASISTGAWGVYTDKGGTIELIPISNGVSEEAALAMRLPGGALVVGSPEADNHAATKKYVDDHTIALYRHDLEVVIISDSGTFHATLSAYTKSNEAINTVGAFKGLMKKDGKSTKSIPLFGAFKASNESVTHICGMSYLDGAGYALKNVVPETAPIMIANYSTFSVTDTVVTL